LLLALVPVTAARSASSRVADLHTRCRDSNVARR